MTDQENAESEEHTPDIDEWVEPIVEEEESIRLFLSELEQSYIEGSKDGRRKLRNFAEQSYYHEAFRGIYFAVSNDDEFFEDVEESKGESVANRIRDLGEDFSNLENEFSNVYYEQYFGHKNPVDGYQTAIKQINPHTGPIITVKQFSAQTQLLEKAGPPSSLLNNVATSLAAVVSELNGFSEVPKVTESEFENVEHEYEHIESHMEELSEVIETIEGQLESNEFDQPQMDSHDE